MEIQVAQVDGEAASDDTSKPGGGKDVAKASAGGSNPNAQRDPKAMVKSIMTGMDKNSDGVIDRDEWPADRADRFDPTDVNSDGSIDAGEFQAAMKKVMAAMQAGGGPGGGRPGPASAGPGS